MKRSDHYLFIFVAGLMIVGACSRARFSESSELLEDESTITSSSDAVILDETSIAPLPPEEDSSKNLSLTYGNPNPKVDYLFVVDNSVSMNSIIDAVRSGFNEILKKPEVFSKDSRLAVMSTMIGDPNNFDAIGPPTKGYTGIELEPSFLQFVNKARIQMYKSSVPAKAALWPLNGCDNEWFAPTEVDSEGRPCLDAALQSTFSGLGVEAGIHAFHQLLMKRGTTPTFRDEALVNIIFVSDTHDPGTNAVNLVETRPSLQMLKDRLMGSNKVKGIKFHAIAPQDPCQADGGEQVYDRSYYTLADQSGGEKGDSCRLNDYTALLSKMIANGEVQDPTFKLDPSAVEVIKVEVDGTEVPYVFNKDERTVRIEGLSPLKSVNVSISYR